MTKRELVTKHREAILGLAAKHGVRTDLRLFGSVARGEDDEDSDVDILARFHGKEGFDAFGQQFDFEEELARELACKVHVVSEHPYLRERFRRSIEPDLQPL